MSEAACSLEKDVRVVRSPCMGACDKAPVAAIGHSMIENVTPTSIQKNLHYSNGRISHNKVSPIRIDEYIEKGGYKLLKACISQNILADEILEKLAASGLRGLGGAGFPTSRKWGLVRMLQGKKHLL